MFNIGVSLLNRLSTLLALKSLPDEAALQGYMRNAFRGIFFLILGSVLLGAAITAAIYIAYEQMLNYGYDKPYAIVVTLGITFLLVATCFVLADKCLSQRFCRKLPSKSIIDEKLEYIKDMAGGSINGFIEGLLSKPKTRK